MASKSDISVKLKVPQKAIPERNETRQISETELTTARAKEKPKPSSQTTSKERGPKNPKPPKSTTSVIVHEELPPSSPEERVCPSDSSATTDQTSEFSVTDHEGRPPSPSEECVCPSDPSEISVQSPLLSTRVQQEQTKSSRTSSSSSKPKQGEVTSHLKETATSTVSEPTIFSRCFKCCSSGKRVREQEKPTPSSQPTTQEHGLNNPKPPKSSAFYKKIYKSGRIIFMKDNNRFHDWRSDYDPDADFIKINANAKNKESILQQVAEGVVNKLWNVRPKNILLSVTAGADELDKEGRRAVKEGINKMLPGTCMVTCGTNDGVTRLVGSTVYEFNKNTTTTPEKCPSIGIVCVDRIQNKDTLKPWELTRGAFGIDSEGQLFTVDKSGERWTLNPSSLTEVKVQSDGSTTATALTDDDHGTSCSPRFAIGDLVQIGIDLESVKSAMGTLWLDCKERTLGKIGLIVNVDKSNNTLEIRVNNQVWWYSPKAVTLLTGERFIGPLKTHFETYEPSDKDDKLVKAVMEDSVENVYAIIRRTYQDFHEMTSASFGVDDSYSFFVVDANGDRRTFNPDDLTKDSITNAIESNANHIPRDFAEGDLVVILESANYDEEVGKVCTIVGLDTDKNGLYIRVCGNSRFCLPRYVALVNRGRYDLLKEHFKTHKSAYEIDELQQAVNEDKFEKVTGIIRKAYTGGERICKYDLTTAIDDLQDKANTERYLNPHHDLFVLVEDSTLNEFGGEIEFRAILEKRIASEMIRSRMQDITKHDKSVQQVNVVNLVINGNLNTLETVTHAMNFGTVSVVLQGSKGVADNIADEVKSTTDIQKRHDEDYEYSKNELVTNTTIPDKMFKTFQETFHKQPYLLWIWDLRRMPDNPVKRIFEIYWKANWIVNHLWSFLDHDLYVVSKLLASTDCSPLNTDDLVCYLCIHDKIEPVRILVQHLGSRMNSVWIDALQYKKMCNEADPDGLLKGLRPKSMVPSANKDLATIMEIIQIMKARPVQGTIDKAVSSHWMPHPDVSSNPTQKNRVLCFGEKKEKKDESKNRFLPYWDYLFLWSCMRRKHALAEILFRKVENPIAMALITHNLFKAVERQTDDKVLKTEMQKYAKKASSWATGILNECAQKDDTKTNQILTLVMPVWKKTCIGLAIESKHMEFLDQQAVRNLLGTVWNGKLEDTATWRFFACIMCPALSLKLLKYKTDKRTTQDNPVERPAQANISSNIGKIKVFLLAPKTKIAYNLISYVMFLSLFAYVLLFDLASTISKIEYVLMTWVLAILGEEIRQMATSDEKKEYFYDGWNIIDICSIVMFFIGFGLRFEHFQDPFDWPRVVLAVDFVAFCFRLIHIFSVQNILGPKLIMIQQMFQDLVYFLVILVVFLLSYAIASHSILFPNSPVIWETFPQIIRKPYWHLYGELFLEDTEDCTTDVSLWTNGTNPRCPSKTGQIVVPIMMGMYMLFTNILLLNLLIAMFSHTFTVIHKQSESLWCYQRYFILKEYGMRPALCPPLNICWHIYDLVQRACGQHATVEDPFRFDNDEKRSNSARTDAVQSTIIGIHETRDDHCLDLQKRVRTLVCKVYGDVDAIVEKNYSILEDINFVFRINQMANTLQQLWKVVSPLSNTCTNFLLKKFLISKKEMDILDNHIGFYDYNEPNIMNTIEKQICDLETKIDVLYNIPLHVLQRNSFDKYIESENKTQSERTNTMIKTINDRLNHLTKEDETFRLTMLNRTNQASEHEEKFRDAISTRLKDMEYKLKEKAELMESKTKHEEEFRNAISTQLTHMQEKIDIGESKRKEEEIFRITMLKRTNQAFKEEEEFRHEMRKKNKDAIFLQDEKEDQLRKLIMDGFKKVQDNLDALNKKVHALEVKTEGQHQVEERTHP